MVENRTDSGPACCGDRRKILAVDHARPWRRGAAAAHREKERRHHPSPGISGGGLRIGLDSVSMADEDLRGRKVYASWRAAMMPGGRGFRRAVRTMVRSVDLDPGGRGHSHLGSWENRNSKPKSSLHVNHVAFFSPPACNPCRFRDV